MWASQAYGVMSSSSGAACWNLEREGWDPARIATTQYFDMTLQQSQCTGTNWFEGTFQDGINGGRGKQQDFTGAAPALLGFAQAIDDACTSALANHNREWFGHAERCVKVNRNILSMFSERMPYNICRNVEWLVCAARGQLQGQVAHDIIFATAPKTLTPDGPEKPLGQCGGWKPEAKPAGGYGYTLDDIFYLEVCLLNEVCTNSDAMFELEAGQAFECDFDVAAYRELQNVLTSSPLATSGTAIQCA